MIKEGHAYEIPIIPEKQQSIKGGKYVYAYENVASIIPPPRRIDQDTNKEPTSPPVPPRSSTTISSLKPLEPGQVTDIYEKIWEGDAEVMSYEDKDRSVRSTEVLYESIEVYAR